MQVGPWSRGWNEHYNGSASIDRRCASTKGLYCEKANVTCIESLQRPPVPMTRLNGFGFCNTMEALQGFWIGPIPSLYLFTSQSKKADPNPKEGSPKPAKIFAIDNNQLVNIRREKYEVRLPYRIMKMHKDNDKDPEVLKYFLEKDMPDLDFVLPINPFRLNERLAIQQGIFLFCPTTLRSFSDVYNEMRSNYRGLTSEIVFEVSPEFMVRCLAYLQGLNMTSTTLFPGIDGLCRGPEHKIAVDSNWNLL